jgi:hypothetical protein
MTEQEIIEAVNSTPAILSLLYDLNLLPEQTMDKPSFAYTANVVEHVMAAISAEREACAQIADDQAKTVNSRWIADEISIAIRARSKQIGETR